MPRFRNPVVSTADILDGSITTAKLADGAVATGKLADLAVEAAKLANSSVTATKIANLAVGTAAIANAAIGSAKIANVLQSDNWDGTTVAAQDATEGWRIERDTGDLGIEELFARAAIRLFDEDGTGADVILDNEGIRIPAYPAFGIPEIEAERASIKWYDPNDESAVHGRLRGLDRGLSMSLTAFGDPATEAPSVGMSVFDELDSNIRSSWSLWFDLSGKPRATLDLNHTDVIEATEDGLQISNLTHALKIDRIGIDTSSVSGAVMDVPDVPVIVVNNSTGLATAIEEIHVNGSVPDRALLILWGGSGVDPIVKDGPNLRLDGSVNFPLGFGDTLMLMAVGSIWYEISRSNN